MLGFGRRWWARQDLNPRPSRYERPALTAELQAHAVVPSKAAGLRLQAARQPCAALVMSDRLAGKTPRWRKWAKTARHQSYSRSSAASSRT